MLQIRTEEDDDVLFCAKGRRHRHVRVWNKLHRLRRWAILHRMRTRRLPSSRIRSR